MTMTHDKRKNYSAWNITLPDVSKRAHFSEVATCLAQYAHLAPNTHNTQPWRFEACLDTQSFTVYVEPTRILSESDKDARQAEISIGAAVKNIEVAAHALGWKTNLDISTCDDYKVANIHFEYEGSPGLLADLVNSIAARKTNRARYDRTQTLLPDYELELDAIAKRHNVTLRLIKDQLTKAAIADLQEKADSVVINNPKFSQELADWIITDHSESGLGMPGSGFGVAPDKTESVINSLRNGLTNDLDLRKALPQADREGINSAYAELIILSNDDSLPARIHAGMAYQEIALKLTGIGWASAMNAAFVEVQAFSLLLKTRLAEFRKTPMIACRIGKPLPYEAGDVHRGHSPRLPLSEVFSITA